jgi:hypothetical protein
MDSNPDNQWVAARLASVAPAWTPDLSRARALVQADPARPHRAGIYGVLATAAAVLVVAVVAPPARTLSQQLWFRVFVSRVEVVRLDLSQVPLDTSIKTNGLQHPVADLTEATEKAGFRPYLPSADVLADAPALSVTGPVEILQTIHTAHLEAALARVGATDLDVPAEWNGITLRGLIGPLVVANYPGEIEVLQTTAIRLEMPAGFQLARLAEIVFRTAGLSWWEARKLGEEYAARPAWLLDVPADDLAVIERVPLTRGDGLLIEDVSDAGEPRATMIVSRPTRLYSVSSPSREVSVRLASTLP